MRASTVRRFRILRTFWCTVCCLAISACAMGPPPATIRDLETLPQDAGHYLQTLESPFIASDRQAALYRAFLEGFFGPWNRSAAKHAAAEVFSGLSRYSAKQLYGENNLPLPSGWWDEMRVKADAAAYPSRHLPAIAVVHASMRVLPTQKPAFSSPEIPGEGFPFDCLQNSLVAAGTPLLVTHVSRDGQWALVETDWAAGWVRWPEIALAGPDFIAAYTAAPLAGFLADNVPVTGPGGLFLVSGRVGMALPLAANQECDGHLTVRVPVRDHLGRARMLEARVPETDCRPLPFAATRENAVRVLNALLGQNYGWGGLYENRDCSALIQDVLAGFGVFLPRNSRDQAGAGRWVPLAPMQGPEKEQRILRQGRPLRTILYMPGHVMLYLGQDPTSGRAVVCHAMWGLRVVGASGHSPGRLVVGKTVITSLEAGRELAALARPGGLLLEKVTGMVLLD